MTEVNLNWIASFEVSFTRYFYRPQPLRTFREMRADIEALEHEIDGLLGEILVETEHC